MSRLLRISEQYGDLAELDKERRDEIWWAARLRARNLSTDEARERARSVPSDPAERLQAATAALFPNRRRRAA